MSQQQDDRWLEVLAGRAQGDDRDTLQAASLRGFLQQQAAADEQLDAQADKRMANLLQGRLDAWRQAQAGAAPAPAPGLLARIGNLFASGRGQGTRYALVAAAVFAVVLVPGLLNHERWFGGDDPGYKSVHLPDRPGSSTGNPAPGLPLPAEQSVSSADPGRDAAAFLSALARDGVQATVTGDGEDRLVEGDVGAEHAAQVRSDGAAIGVGVPADGHLRVRFHKSP